MLVKGPGDVTIKKHFSYSKLNFRHSIGGAGEPSCYNFISIFLMCWGMAAQYHNHAAIAYLSDALLDFQRAAEDVHANGVRDVN
jgi:hypothetical protein